MSTRRIVSSAVLAAALLASTLAAQEVEKEADRAKRISLNSHVIDTTAPPEKIPAHLLARTAGTAAGPAGEVLLVKFPAPVTGRQIAALERSGARIYTYLPHYAFLVRTPVTAAGHAKALRAMTGAGASWIGPYHPYYKISRAVAAITAVGPGTDKAVGGFKSVMVDVFPDADLAAVVDRIQDLGVQGVVAAKPGSFFSRVRLLLSPAEIARFRDGLAQIPEVFWLDIEPRRELLNDTTIWVGQSGLSAGQTTPVFDHGIHGEGQVVAIIDTGIDADMCYFRDTALGLPPTNQCNGGTVVNTNQRKILAVDFLAKSECRGGITNTEWDTQNHGTHVAGTVAGDNFAHLITHDTADGMAPGAKLVIQDAGFKTDNCGDLPGIGCPVVDLKPLFLQAYTQGARLHTNSWGDNENGAVQNNYTAASQDVDQFMWDHKDDLIFFAAGNSGPASGTVGSPSTNKNGVSVGATLRGTSADSMASFSSCGPTDDGRVKPDITIPGSSIVSAGNDGNVTTNNCGTRTMSGTSMASPGATGLTALIRQYYTDGWYPTGAATPGNGFTPSNALLKATLVNSAVQMSGSGTTPIPSSCQGWGRILLDNALFWSGDARKLTAVDDTAGFATGSVNVDKTFTYTVNSNAQPLKVTLAWTDFPSTPAANPHLNNDLDLIVTGPGGTFQGNVFSGGVSVAGGSPDRRNNLEQVLLAAPAAGSYTVTVRAINVPSGPQPFALVITGDGQ
jgi:subtilase family protein